MKTLVTLVVSLLVGLAIGYYVGFRHCDWNYKNGGLLAQETESSDGLLAAFSVSAIISIDSGQDQKAVQLLSQPIADYVYVFGSGTSTNETRLKLLAAIEKLASTNQTVAAKIAERKSDKLSGK